MRSVADDLRARDTAHVLQLAVAERIALALSLGDEDLQRFSQANHLEPAVALARLRASRSRGRRPSVADLSDSR